MGEEAPDTILATPAGEDAPVVLVRDGEDVRSARIAAYDSDGNAYVMREDGQLELVTSIYLGDSDLSATDPEATGPDAPGANQSIGEWQVIGISATGLPIILQDGQAMVVRSVRDASGVERTRLVPVDRPFESEPGGFRPVRTTNLYTTNEYRPETDDLEIIDGPETDLNIQDLDGTGIRTQDTSEFEEFETVSTTNEYRPETDDLEIIDGPETDLNIQDLDLGVPTASITTSAPGTASAISPVKERRPASTLAAISASSPGS